MFLIVFVIGTLLVSLTGCAKKEDESPNEGSAARTSAGRILLKDALASWKAGNKDDAVRHFLSITWTDPSVLENMPSLLMSEKEFIALAERDRIGIRQEVIELSGDLRGLVRHVLSIGDDRAVAGDTETAQKHYDAVLQCGRTLSGPERLLIIQHLGKAIASKASQSEGQ